MRAVPLVDALPQLRIAPDRPRTLPPAYVDADVHAAAVEDGLELFVPQERVVCRGRTVCQTLQCAAGAVGVADVAAIDVAGAAAIFWARDGADGGDAGPYVAAQTPFGVRIKRLPDGVEPVAFGKGHPEHSVLTVIKIGIEHLWNRQLFCVRRDKSHGLALGVFDSVPTLENVVALVIRTELEDGAAGLSAEYCLGVCRSHGDRFARCLFDARLTRQIDNSIAV